MKREEILDKIEAIQDKNYEQFSGSNEAELHIREDVADLIEEILQASGVSDTNEPCDLAGVMAMLPSEYSWQKHQWKSKGNLKTTINELVTLKDLSKKELILLIELIKDHLGN